MRLRPIGLALRALSQRERVDLPQFEFMYILGINVYHPDVSAVLIRDGQLIAALEEERFRRVKHFAGFPAMAIRRCLEIGGIEGKNIDAIAISRNPRAHLLWK